MLLTLLQLHLLLVAPALAGWPSWAMLPAPALSAHVQSACARSAAAQAVPVRRAAPAPAASVVQARNVSVPASVPNSAPVCPAHAPRAP